MNKRKLYSPLILIYTEGKDDAQLIKQFQKIYRTNFRIRQGNGSTPEIVLNDCIKEAGDFDTRYCIVDGDKINNRAEFGKLVQEKQQTCKYKLVVVVSRPCIESVNFALLFGDRSGFNKANCGALKTKLKLMLGKLSREDYYESHLTKKLISQNTSLLKDQDFKILIELFVKYSHHQF